MPIRAARWIVSLCLIFGGAAAHDSASANPPNIVFIFVDDQGYYDLGCYGATEVETPRIDAMAKTGTRFTDYYAAAPICSPSRAGLLTGCYPRRIGNEVWVHRADSRSGIHPDELTIAELLKDKGYATACIGKWHLGSHQPFLPRNQGFDHYFGLLHNLDPVEIVYFEDKGGVPLMRNGDVVKRPADPAELTRLYTDEAIQFMERNKEGPFFVYLPHTMLHNPLGVSEEFKGGSNWGEYGDAIQELDHNVGRIFDSLERMGIDDNTIVIYASDNGRGPGRTPEQKIRGHKLSTYEGGIRVPAIAWGPGLGMQAGTESAAVVRAMDWYPTLATFAGIEIPEGRVIDGRDISPLLKGETKFVPHPGMKRSLNASLPLRRRWGPGGEWAPLIHRNEYNDAFFYHGSHGALAAVRWRNWKLYLNPRLQLYDLGEDPGESKLARNPEIQRKLRGMAILFQEEMRRDARPAGEAPPPPRADGRTEISQTTLDGLDSKHDVTYARYGDRTLEMDIYRPKGAWGDLPAVVCIHGGGWAKGDRTSHAKLAQSLASRGYVAATISYRLSGEAPFPAAIQDCKAAVRFLRANAGEYGIDAGNIGAIGLSAGGHLTALLASSSGVEELEGEGGNADFSSAIQAAVPMGAQSDFMSDRTREISKVKEIWKQFLGGSQEDQPATYRLASPLNHLAEKGPPCWFITGEKDDPSTHADGFRRRMEGLGIQSGLTIIKGAPHPFLGKQVWFDEMIEVADTFFGRTLKLADSVRGDNAEWLKEETGRQIAGCRVKADSGVWLHTPDGVGHYKALWTRDYYYFAKYAGEFIEDANLKASIQYVLDGQREDGCIPDRIDANGKAIYSPGGVQNPLADHALDNASFLALLACEYVRRSGDSEFFREIEPQLRRGLDHVRRADNGLVYNPPANPQCVYGFTDIVAKTGHLLFTSMLYYQACVEMEEIQDGIGGVPGADYKARADLIRKNLPMLWDDNAGMYLAADEDCRQIDIWGSAYAAEIGLATDGQKGRIADYLLAHWDEIFQCGQVRHLPGNEGWQRLFLDSHPVGSYINGAYWATPLPWVVPLVARKSPGRARQLVNDAIDDFQANGVAECINGETRKVPNFVASVTNLYAASQWLATHIDAEPKPMNVLLITVDDLRPELASYLTDGIRTPHIDRLAARGLQFNAAYCQYPVCNPSRVSFLTGLRPDELAIFSNKVSLRREWPDLVSLPQLYRKGGYFTAGLGKLFHQGTDAEGRQTLFRDDLSFEHFYKAVGREPEIGSEGKGRVLGDGTVKWARWRAAEGGDMAQADGMLAAEAVRLLEGNRDKPFFIGVGFHKPHDPFVAPKEYFDLYPLDEIKLADDPSDRTPMLKHALPDAYNFETFADKDRREFKRAYHACTTFVDAQVGKVLDAMDRLELWDSTIVVLLGDHGYHLGEHGWWNKVTVFDIGARVPLVMWVPKSGGMGTETEAVVELLDLYPSLVDLCHLKPPHKLQGESLRPLFEDPSASWKKPAFTQVVRSRVGMGYSVRYGDWRLTQWGNDGSGGLELYNVVKDKEGYFNHANDPEHAATLDLLYGSLKKGYPRISRRAN